VQATRLPTGEPLTGTWVRLDLLGEADIDEMYPLLSDPRIYDYGYLMHRRPVSAGDSRALVRARFLVGQGQADGRGGGGRFAYAIRLIAGSGLGAGAGRHVLAAEADLANEGIHLGNTLYGSRWWGTQVNPEAKLLLLAHCFEDCGYGRVKIQTDTLNTRSQAASPSWARSARACCGGIKREDGTFRDSVVFSVLIGEWPAVKAACPAAGRPGLTAARRRPSGQQQIERIDYGLDADRGPGSTRRGGVPPLRPGTAHRRAGRPGSCRPRPRRVRLAGPAVRLVAAGTGGDRRSLLPALPHAGHPAAGAAAAGQALLALGHDPLGVTAGQQDATRFAAAWTDLTGASARVMRRSRLFLLGALTPLDPPAGAARVATTADRDLLCAWLTEFATETGDSPGPLPGTVDDELSYGGLTLWEAGGIPVAVAGVKRPAAGVVRVGPVWTPPDQRRHGYAAAATAAVSQVALDAGADSVVLFTDLASEASNALYPRLGYQPGGRSHHARLHPLARFCEGCAVYCLPAPRGTGRVRRPAAAPAQGRAGRNSRMAARP
jgi:RimJ/RimL family protein N-acetyltransferase